MSQIRIAALVTLFAHSLFGGVVLDGSFGTRGALPGPNFMIPASFGKQMGGNLFQSFSQFNLTNSQSATFSGPNNVHNILARVTSGSPSSIDGTINSTIPEANLFFLNPAGVLFGSHAQINVSGCFAVSTANYLKLADGGKFYTSLGGGDMLTSAPVSAFGFLKAPAGISVTGNGYTLNEFGLIVPGPGLRVAAGKSFSAVAGDITINGGQIAGEGSRVNLISVGSNGEAKLDATDINSAVDVTQFAAMGNINFTNLALIYTSGAGGGPVVMRGGNVFLDNSQIFSETLGPINGGAIDISADSIVIQNSSISALTNLPGMGNGGDVTLTAKSLLSLRGGRVYANTGSKGNGGDITMTAKKLVIDSTSAQSSIIETTTTFGDLSTDRHGNAGNIALTADSILIQGALTIIDTDSVSSAGNAGNLTLTSNSLVIEGDLHSFPRIESNAEGTVGDGHGGNVTVVANSVVIGPFADIAAQSHGGVDAGSILVDAGTLQFKPGGFISVSTFGTGAGGGITVLADSVLIDGGDGSFSTGIFARTEGSTGKGGDITVTAKDLVLQNGGAISAESISGEGNAGEVVVHTDKLKIKDQGAITTTTSGSGHAGSITVHAGDVKMKDGSIASSSTSSGEAGSIKLVSDGTIRLWDQSKISVSAPLTNGGDITIKAPVLVSLINSDIDATAGNTGGNITIDPIALQLKNSTISASAGIQGGHIDLFTSFLVGPVKAVTSEGSLLLAFNSSITATGGTSSGTVNVTAPELDLGAQLITLPTSLLSAENQLQERCTSLLQGDFSSFISIGRGGTEPAPEELQSTF